MNERILLTQVSSISKKYDLLVKKIGSNFNIFDITNISHDEVKICRVIHELLSTKGSHNQGNTTQNYFLILC